MKGSAKSIREILQGEPGPKEEICSKVHRCLIESYDDSETINYLMEVCEILRDYVDPSDCWRIFK